MKFHHCNAILDVHANVKKFLEANKFVIVPQSAYSPGPKVHDFWLFSYIKWRLNDYTSIESLSNQITETMKKFLKK